MADLNLELTARPAAIQAWAILQAGCNSIATSTDLLGRIRQTTPDGTGRCCTSVAVQGFSS